MYWNGHMSTGGWILSVLWTVIIIALVIAGIVWLVSALNNRGSGATASSGPARGGSARDILDRRLASGELTIEQYQELRDALAGESPSTLDSPVPTLESQPRRPADAPS